MALKPLKKMRRCVVFVMVFFLTAAPLGCNDKVSSKGEETDNPTLGIDAGSPDAGQTTNIDSTETDQSSQDLTKSPTLNQYGILRTIAGTCRISDKGDNGWEERFEGGPAIEAELSRPHMAMADEEGNIFIADKDAHAVRKITPDGMIHTVAGTNQVGEITDTPGPGTDISLDAPNGLWVNRDGTVFILDLNNDRVRRLDKTGELTTLFISSVDFDLGRGIWVRDDEQLVFVASGDKVLKWTPDEGVTTYAEGFVSLGNIIVDPAGHLVVTDRSGHRVYRIDANGNKTPIAGNGETSGGGDGIAALETGLNEVRGVWFIEDGSYFLATHEGNRVWFVDPSGIIHLFLDGGPDAHSGDGEMYDTPGAKISEARAVTVAPNGDVIITENDCGYIRVVKNIQ